MSKQATEEQVFRKVLCKDRLPENKGKYIVNSENSSVINLQGTEDIFFNGKEIYEGDIIDHYAMYGYVIYENGAFSMSSNANTQFCNCRQPMAYHDVSKMEVIGNIYENPELLK